MVCEHFDIVPPTIVFFETFFLAVFMGNPSLTLSEVLCLVKYNIWSDNAVRQGPWTVS